MIKKYKYLKIWFIKLIIFVEIASESGIMF